MAKPIATPSVTFSPEQLQAVIAQAIAEHEAAKAQQCDDQSFQAGWICRCPASGKYQDL